MSQYRVYPKCGPHFAIFADTDKGKVVLKTKNPDDSSQVWDKKTINSSNQNFALVNDANKCAIKRPDGPGKPLLLECYDSLADEKFHWTTEMKPGREFNYIVPVNNHAKICWTVYDDALADAIVGCNNTEKEEKDDQLWAFEEYKPPVGL